MSQGRASRGYRNCGLAAARRVVHNVVPASLLQPTAVIAYNPDVGKELYRLMLDETKRGAGCRARWLPDAQLLLA